MPSNVSTKSDEDHAAKYEAEARQYKKVENALAPLEKPAQIAVKAGEAAQIGLIAIEVASSGGLAAAPGIAAKKAEKGAITKASEYVVGKVVQRGVAKEAEQLAKNEATKRQTSTEVVKSAAKFESHHLLPKEFKAQFEKAGLNIENYKIDLSKQNHRLKPDGLHASEENWNKDWRDFFRNNPSATRAQMLNQLHRMKNDPRYKDKLI